MSPWLLWVACLVALGGATAGAECLPSGRATFATGLEALSRGDLSTAEARFRDVVDKQPTCAEARNNLAVVLFELGRREEADAELRRAVALNPDYQRARFNLRRVEASLQGSEAGSQGEPLASELAAEAPGTTASPVAPPGTPALPAAPANLAVLEPEGATACVIDAAARRICVYRRSGPRIVPDQCVAIAAMPGGVAVEWLAASAVSAGKIRLVDATKQERLRIVAGGGQAKGNALRIKRGDLERLSTEIVPWRTGWVLPKETLPAPAAARAVAEVREALEGWRRAWEGKQFDTYAGCYAPSFVPQGNRSLRRWRANKRHLFERSGTISVQLGPTSLSVLNGGATVITSFEQAYHSDIYASRDFKVLRWRREGDRWTITAETVLWEGSGGK